MRRAAGIVLLVLSMIVLAACASEDMTTCDPAAARAIVRSSFGVPAYAGQAMVTASCGGSGGVCHSETATREQRAGAPHGLDYDLVLADDANNVRLDRLRRGLGDIRAHRAHLMAQVRGNAMPPREMFVSLASDYRFEDGRVLPTVRTDAGKEVLRNWLACGAPVVERAVGASAGVGDVVPYAPGTAPAPRFSEIWSRVLHTTCGVSGCHSGSVPTGSLDMGTLDAAYTNLVGRGTGGPACGGGGRSRVVAGNPDASTIIHKLEGRDAMGAAVCGERMPFGGTPLPENVIASIREWIARGAPND